MDGSTAGAGDSSRATKSKKTAHVSDEMDVAFDELIDM